MITMEDLIKYGLARDVGSVRESTLRERNTAYDEQLAKLERDLNRRTQQAEESGQGRKKITTLEREYNAAVKKLEADRTKALTTLEQRFDAEADMYQRRLEDPKFIRGISEARLAEQREELQRIKTESEGVERESAERQAGRMRARSGRGARQMLSSARLSPQPMGVGGQSTLGTAPF